MGKTIRFLGVCIIISALLISSAIFIHALYQRYVYVNREGADVIFDRLTGVYYTSNYRVDFIRDSRTETNHEN